METKDTELHTCFDMSTAVKNVMLGYVFFIYIRLIKTVYKKLKNIDWLMLHSLQETKCDPLLLLLLLLLQPTQMKFE